MRFLKFQYHGNSYFHEMTRFKTIKNYLYFHSFPHKKVIYLLLFSMNDCEVRKMHNCFNSQIHLNKYSVHIKKYYFQIIFPLVKNILKTDQ